MFRTGWETGDPAAVGQGTTKPSPEKDVQDAVCGITDLDAHSGKRSLRIAGKPYGQDRGYAYFSVSNTPVAIYPDTILSYWMKPLNTRSMQSGIDLTFSDGTPMRNSGIVATVGGGVHPCNPKGSVGEWKQIIIPVGRYFQDKTVEDIVFAFDGSPGDTGPFETLFDDLVIESKLSDVPWDVTAHPAGGVYAGRVEVDLKAPAAYRIRYTLDGTPPCSDSPLYSKPILLDSPGLHDLRYVIEATDGRISCWTFGQLYDIARANGRP